jgi:hypothetical protein
MDKILGGLNALEETQIKKELNKLGTETLKLIARIQDWDAQLEDEFGEQFTSWDAKFQAVYGLTAKTVAPIAREVLRQRARENYGIDSEDTFELWLKIS